MQRPDLTTMIPLPHDPAYLVARDGRVYSHKKGGYLAERKTLHPSFWRVRVGRDEFRVRDLAHIFYGSGSTFEERAWEWIDEHTPDDQEAHL